MLEKCMFVKTRKPVIYFGEEWSVDYQFVTPQGFK